MRTTCARGAYREFYRSGSILRSAATKPALSAQLRHAAYTGAWKKCEPLWDALIRARLLGLVPSVIFGGSMTLLVVAATAKLAPKLRRLDLRDLQ